MAQRCLMIYASLTGNTEKVALRMKSTFEKHGWECDAFKLDHLYPMAESIWSGSREQLGAFPARAFMQFFRNHGLLSLNDRPRWRTITGGSVTYVDRLCASFRQAIRLNTPVASIARDEQGVEIRTPDHEPERFDKVVIACHADQALRMLARPTEQEKQVLAAFPYAANDVALHSDPVLMPRRRQVWSSWNYHRSNRPQDPVALTYDMNRLQSLPGQVPYLVTLNRNTALDEQKIHGRFNYEHPQYDVRSPAMQQQHDQLNGRNHTFYCGALSIRPDGIRVSPACVALGQPAQALFAAPCQEGVSTASRRMLVKNADHSGTGGRRC